MTRTFDVVLEKEPGKNQLLRYTVWSMIAIFVLTVWILPESVIKSVWADNSALHGQWWRLITYNFLHGGVLHILFNMLALVFFASDVRQHFSQRAAVTIFLASGIIGGIPQLLLSPELPMVGASAGIMGLWGAMLAGGLRMKDVPTGYRRLSEAIQWKRMLFWTASQIVLDHVIPGIAGWAHLGGLVVGFSLGFVWRMNGATLVYASRRGIVRAIAYTFEKNEVGSKKYHFSTVTLETTPDFDEATDFVFVERQRLGFLDRHECEHETLVGEGTQSHDLAVVAEPANIDGLGEANDVRANDERLKAEQTAATAAK